MKQFRTNYTTTFTIDHVLGNRPCRRLITRVRSCAFVPAVDVAVCLQHTLVLPTLDDLLHIPAIHDEPCQDYREAYEMCVDLCNHPNNSFNNLLLEPEESVHEDT